MVFISTARVAASVLALGLALAGCASPYGPQGLTGGFREQQLAPNSYRVTYNGNGHTQEEQVVNYWLYRCAELTIQNGYSYFGMVPESGRPSSSADDFDSLKRMASFRPGEDAPRMMQVKS